jgi:2-keto-4-pentenoate hydratase
MTTPSHEAAARFLFEARKRGTGGPRIPAEHRPASVEDALAIQARVAQLVGQPIGGYKCSAPNAARPVSLAPIFAPTIARSSPCRVITTGTTARIEPEIAFVMARDLPDRSTPYSDGEIREAVMEARLVLEILGSRYADPAGVEFPENLADSIQNQGMFVGPVVSDAWNRKLEAFPITVRAGDEVLVTRDGKHPDGHPLRPLAWLANYLADRGDPLRAGMIVTTGSYCGMLDVPLGQPLTIVYGDLGSVSVTMNR